MIQEERAKLHQLTTRHVRAALSGEIESIAWVVERFTPTLKIQAEYRLGKHLRRHYEVEDLVNDVWATVLPKLGDIVPRDARYTPVLIKFLSSTLLFRYKTLMQKLIQGKPLVVETGESEPDGTLSAHATGVVSRAMRSEQQDELRRCIDELAPEDREIIILRGLEQTPREDVATLLGVSPNVVSSRYARALKKLRTRLPRSVFSELDDDG